MKGQFFPVNLKNRHVRCPRPQLPFPSGSAAAVGYVRRAERSGQGATGRRRKRCQGLGSCEKMHRGTTYFQPPSATLLFQSSLFFTTKEQQWLLSRATSDVTIKILRTQSCAATGSHHLISLAASVGSFAISTRCSCIIVAPSIGLFFYCIFAGSRHGQCCEQVL
jgi:hypothetical protein